MSGYTLRPYQQDAIDAVWRDWTGGEKAVAIELPTGGGKTMVMGEAARRIRERGGRTLIAVHREELIGQALRDLRLTLGPSARLGVVQGTTKQTAGVEAAVGMVQTLSTEGGLRAVQRGGFASLLIDECHHAAAPTYRKVLAALPEAYTLGVSATLARSDKLALGEVFSKISYVKPIKEMIREGWLVRPRGRHVFIEGLDLRKVRRRSGDFADGALASAMKDALAPEAVARAWMEHAKGRPTIGFAPTVELAYLFTEAFRAQGVRSKAVHGDQSAAGKAERAAAVAAFRAGEIDVLWNVGLFTEGFDVPEVSCVIMARPTSSAVLFTQCVGRGLRLAPGKTDCLVLDVVGVLGKHRLASLATLGGAASEEETPDDLLAYEDDWDDRQADDDDGLLLGEDDGPGGGTFVPEFVDGALSWSEVDLFEESDFAWLRTAGGTPFILHDGNVIFPVVRREVAGVQLAMVPVDQQGGEFSGEVYPDIPAAMTAVEQWLARAGTYVRRSESWRNRKDVTLKQQLMAQRWGVVYSEGMTKGDVSDAINVAIATNRIDHLPMVREGL